MSKLEELINQLCPDGVEYKKIGDVFTTITDYTAAGSFADIAKNVRYLNDKDFAQLIRTTDLKSKFVNDDKFIYVDEHAFKYLWRVNLNEECLVLPNIGNCGEVYHVIPEMLPHSNSVLGPNAILIKSKIANVRFLYHLLQTHSFQMQLSKITSSTGQTKFNKTSFKGLVIPLPPLPIQEEIVRILDNMTSLTAELTKKLAEEKVARQKQYEYYRDSLLSFDEDNARDGVRWMKLGEVVTKTQNIKWSECEEHKHYIDLSSVDRNTSTILETTIVNKESAPSRAQQFVEINDVIFGTTRPMLKRFCVIPVKYDKQVCSTGFSVLRANTQLVLPKWIYFMISTSNFYNYVEANQQGASYPAITDKAVKSYLIPVPPLEEQQRIVDILDHFDKLCNDISEGLPAEIEARKKQYEYYRDKLLTFKEKEA